MDKVIAWYLVELDGELSSRLSGPEREFALQEIEAHLHELKEELMQPPVHLTPEELVKRFGSPRQIAQAYSQAQAADRKPEHRLIPYLMIGSLCLIGLTPVVAMFWQSAFPGNVPFVGLGVLAVLPFVATSLLARRLMTVPILAGCALAGLVTSCALAATTYDCGQLDGMSIILKRDADKELSRIAQSNALLTSQVRDIDQAMAAFVRNDPTALSSIGQGGTFRYPTSATRSNTLYVTLLNYGTTTNAAFAAERWRWANRFARTHLKDDLQRNEESLASLTVARYSFLQQVWGYSTTMGMPVCILLAFALAVNLLIQFVRWVIRVIRGPGRSVAHA